MDHAATTPVKPEVLSAMLPFFTDCFANASGVYAASREARRAIDTAREQVALLIGALPEEIYFTSGGSEADNWAISGMLLAATPDRSHVITTAIEHHAVLNACEAMKPLGFDTTLVGVSPDGVALPGSIAQSMTSGTALVSVMLANNETGAIQPVGEIAHLAHAQGILVHTDAVQAVGHIPVDVRALDVDLLSLSAHKFGGPKGIGALYVRKGTRLNPLIFGGAQERGMRAGTENTAAIVGMGEAARIARGHLTQTMAYVASLRDALIAQVCARLVGVTVNALRAPRLPGHVHLTIEGADSAMLLMRLDMLGIAASAGSACTSGAVTRSHVLKAMGGRNGADLRLSLGEDNTPEDVDRVVEALCSILKRSHKGDIRS